MSLWSVCQVADRTHLLSGRISFWGGITSIYQTPQFVPRFAFPSHLQSPVASTEQPSWLEIVAKVLLVAGTGYLVYKALEAPKVRRYCSGCGRGGHNARNCPYTGERRAFSTDVVKTGWCECCGYWFAKRISITGAGGQMIPDLWRCARNAMCSAGTMVIHGTLPSSHGIAG